MQAKSGSTAVYCVFVDASVRGFSYMAGRGEDFTSHMSATGVEYILDWVLGDKC